MLAVCFFALSTGALPAVAAPKGATKLETHDAVAKKKLSRKKVPRHKVAKRARVKEPPSSTAFLKRLPDWTLTLRGALALLALFMLWAWRRQDQLTSSPERDMRVAPRTPAYGAHVPRAVVLNHGSSPDPSTLMQDVTIDQFGSPKRVSEALATTDNAQAAADLDAIVTSIHLQHKHGAPAGVQLRRQSGLALPADLARHFDGLAGETLIWSAPFSVPLYASGTIAVTSQRVLSLYRKYQWRLLPPRYEVQVRRHQIQRGRELRTETTTVRRPSFLVAALLCVAWFPVGTAVAVVAVLLHFVAGRRELAIVHRQIRRFYPLASADITAGIAACERPTEQTTPSSSEASA